jgi:peptidoglycan hydrolase-like protein with peptidoglycan-binding domain
LDLSVRTAQVHMLYLGFYSGRIDGINGPATTRALRKMQSKHGLPVTATLDERTRATLHEQYAARIA